MIYSWTDPTMLGLVERVGPVQLAKRGPFVALVRAVASQQLSGAAAHSILRRLKLRVKLTPQVIANTPVTIFRGCGFSNAKAVYLREIGAFATSGGLRGLSKLSDDEVIDRLTGIKGVGRWTAEMLLIFALERSDVWPLGDGGVQQAAKRFYRVRTPKGLQRLGERFRPWRSHAAWYLWRGLEE